MHKDFKYFDSLVEIKEELVNIKDKWKDLKDEETFDFPEYTDDVIENLELTINNPDLNESDKIAKGMNLVNEIYLHHFKHHIDLNQILIFCPTSSKVRYFIRYCHLLDDKQYWKYLGEIHVSQDYEPVPIEILTTLFSSDRKHKEALMNEEELEVFNSLQSAFTIYRAMSKKEFLNGKFRLSWTLNESVATKFKRDNKIKYQVEHIIHKMEVSKKDVIAYLNGREEEEIIFIM